MVPQTYGQVCNALFLVDNTFDPARDFKVPGNQPILRIVMTAAEHTELNRIQTTSGEEQSDATFNCTFISHDGTGTRVVHNSSVRNRGLSSARDTRILAEAQQRERGRRARRADEGAGLHEAMIVLASHQADAADVSYLRAGPFEK